MKKTLNNIIALLFCVSICTLISCKKDNEIYPEAPKRIYIVNRVPEGTITLTGTTVFSSAVTVKKNIPGGVARVYLNKPYDKEVSVTYTFSGTAVQGLDYNPPASLSVVIPAGQYYAEINFTVLNNPAQTTSKTVIISLANVTEGFEPGLGADFKYKIFTYNIAP